MQIIIALIVLVIIVLIGVFLVDKTVTDPQLNQLAKLIIFLVSVLWILNRIFGINF